MSLQQSPKVHGQDLIAGIWIFQNLKGWVRGSWVSLDQGSGTSSCATAPFLIDRVPFPRFRKLSDHLEIWHMNSSMPWFSEDLSKMSMMILINFGAGPSDESHAAVHS